MTPAAKNDTREVMTLNYVVSVKRGGVVYTFSTAADTVADTYVKSPKLLRRILEREQALQKYSPPSDSHARWNREYINDTDFFRNFREAVKKREGTYVLVDTAVGDIFRNLKLLGNRARGVVKSKSAEPGQKAYHVTLRNVFLGKNGRMDLREVHCGCPYFSEKTSSGAEDETYRNECIHISLLRHEIDKRLRHPEWRKDRLEKEGDQPLWAAL